MPYLGRPVTNAGQFETIDDISSDFNGSTKSFTLQVGGTNIQPDASNVTITLDGIVQIPSTAYTITGSTINFSEAPPSSTGFHGVLAGQSQFIESDFITNTHIKSSANISGSKINTDFSGKTIKASVFEGMISGSAQISTDISGSFTSPSSSFSTRTTNLESASGSFSTRVTTIEGSGTVQGVGTSNSPTFAGATINGTLVANEIHTTFVSSSVATITGSNVFGDAVGDLHSFTGSVSISGSQTSLVTAGNVDFNGDLDVDGTTNLDVVDIDGAVDMASTLTIGGDLTIPQKIVHSGDTDTYLSFGTDSLSLYTGGTNVVDFIYGNIYIKGNNKALTGYTTGASAKELIKINDSNLVQIGEASGGDVAITEKLTVGSWDNSNTHGHANLNISSDANEGADSYLNFAAGTTIKGYISYDHHATATSQAMKFYVGDAAVNALTISGDKGHVELTGTAGQHLKFADDGGSSWSGNHAKIQHHNSYMYLQGGSSGIILRTNSGTNSLTMNSSGIFLFANQVNFGTTASFIKQSNFGYSSNYKVLQLGLATSTSAISLGADLTGNSSGGFTGNEIVIPNARGILAPNGANNAYLGVLGVTSANTIEIGRGNHSIVTEGNGAISINTSNNNVTFAGDVLVPEYIKHSGDTDTSLRFTDNTINFIAGNDTTMQLIDGSGIITHGATRATLTKGKNTSSGANVITFTVTVSNTSSWEPINFLVEANYTLANLSGSGYYYGWGHMQHYSATGIAGTSTGNGGASSNITVAVGNYSSNSFDITVTSSATSGDINMIASLDIRARHGISNIVAS